MPIDFLKSSEEGVDLIIRFSFFFSDLCRFAKQFELPLFGHVAEGVQSLERELTVLVLSDGHDPSFAVSHEIVLGKTSTGVMSVASKHLQLGTDPGHWFGLW